MKLIRMALFCALLAGAAMAQDMGGPPPGGGDMGGPPPADMGGAPPAPDGNGPPPPPDEAMPGASQDRTPVAKEDSNAGVQQQSGQAQGEGQQGGSGQWHRGGGMHRGVSGEITAVNPDGFTLKTMQGSAATVKVSSETKFMREQQPIKMSELKVGNTIQVAGTPDANDPTTWNATFVVDHTKQAEEFKASLGKTMIAGEVKAIDGTNLTILRPDGQTQTIAADENTSFKKGRDSITLADIKVGDHVMGRGALKSGVFVPAELRVGGMGMGGGRGQGRGAGPGAGQGQQTTPQ